MATLKNNNVIVHSIAPISKKNEMYLEIPKKRGRPRKEEVLEIKTPATRKKNTSNEIKVPEEAILHLEPSLNRENSRSSMSRIERVNPSQINYTRNLNNVTPHKYSDSEITSKKATLFFFFKLSIFFIFVFGGIKIFNYYALTNEEKDVVILNSYLSDIDKNDTPITFEQKQNYIKSIEQLEKPITNVSQ